jgi:succinate dehydrogenase/fumarate reductase-like Fe-S protein
MMKKWSDKVSELDNLITENCPHDKTSTTTKNYEAGYDYYAEYHKTIKCLVCNKELDHQVTYGTSFG